MLTNFVSQKCSSQFVNSNLNAIIWERKAESILNSTSAAPYPIPICIHSTCWRMMVLAIRTGVVEDGLAHGNWLIMHLTRNLTQRHLSRIHGFGCLIYQLIYLCCLVYDFLLFSISVLSLCCPTVEVVVSFFLHIIFVL